MDAISPRLQQAIAAARAGKNIQARELAQQVTQEEPESKYAWLLLGSLSESEEEQAAHLNQALAIDPDFEPARQRLAKLNLPAPPAIETDAVDEALDEVLEEAKEVAEPLDDAAQTMLAEAADELLETEGSEEAELTMIADEGLETIVSAAADEIIGEASAEAIADGVDEADEALDDVSEAVTQISTTPADFVAQAEADSVPGWLAEAGGFAEGDTDIEVEDLADEAVAADMDDVPDWLQEEPGEDWLDQELAEAEEPELDAWTPDDTLALDLEEEAAVVAAAASDTEVDASADEFLEELLAEEEPAPAQEAKKKRSPTRTYEIILVVLIILAILVVAALAYVIIVPPF